MRHTYTERLRSIYVSTYGILFLGTPHNGGDSGKWVSMLQSISVAVLPRNPLYNSPQRSDVSSLIYNSETLQNINRMFVDIIDRYRIYFFHECKPTNLKGVATIIVDEDSAAPYMEGVERMGIERDHAHMCRFEDENAPGYDVVAEAIQRYAESAPPIVARRWTEEKRMQALERQQHARELLGDEALLQSAGLQPSVLIAPGGTRPNSQFFGFEAEFELLDSKLLGGGKAGGTAMAVLSGPPGAGKSHIAREYVWKHHELFPGGTFWINARSKTAIIDSLSEIAKTCEIPDEIGPGFDEMVLSGSTIAARVKSWFEEERAEWLIVFDGVSFEFDMDIALFTKFLPERSDSCIIFTSVDRTLSSLDPEPIQVGPLALEDAQNLVFGLLAITEPTDLEKDVGGPHSLILIPALLF